MSKLIESQFRPKQGNVNGYKNDPFVAADSTHAYRRSVEIKRNRLSIAQNAELEGASLSSLMMTRLVITAVSA